MKNSTFDLLSTVEYGGCSAKLSPEQLTQVLQDIPLLQDPRILVDISTHDDAGVYQLDEQTALIVTTDFFPPVCSDPYDFGQIAAANSLSDVYAMGGKPLLALNLTMFPSNQIPLEVLREILKGGQDVISEAQTLTMGGHTIDDYPPKYGLAVVGLVHPDQLITNGGAKVGQKLILTKPIGTGVIIAAQRMQMASQDAYQQVIEQMRTLNKEGMEIMQRYGVKGATDVTGFGLIGHAQEMAKASQVTLHLWADEVPVVEQVYELLEEGCIPGGAFRNQRYTSDNVTYADSLRYEQQMMLCDPQTSGGLLFAIDAAHALQALQDLLATGKYPFAHIIGEVKAQGDALIVAEKSH